MKTYKETRFTLLGLPCIYRRRVIKSRGWGFETGTTFNMVHMGKRSLLIGKKNPLKIIWSWV